MKSIESIALAIATFVLSGIIVGIVSVTPLARHLNGAQGLIIWIGAQTMIIAVLLWLLPRKPITYDDANQSSTTGIKQP